MRRVLITALAAAATIAIASPAIAAPTVAATNGAPLSNQIFGVSGADGIHVFGTAPSNGGPSNVEFTGDTALHITSGFAQIQDAGTQGDLFKIIINPDDLFSLMKFSIQLEGTAGTVTVYYLLSGSGLDANNIASYNACGNAFCGVAGSFASGQNDNNNHLLSGGTFDGMMVSTDIGISLFQLKQNSYQVAGTDPPPGSVPEPATWGLMLLGFGGMGMALRRSRRRGKRMLMQIA
jgi:hypothetical protein